MMIFNSIKKISSVIASMAICVLWIACDDGLNETGILGDSIKTSGFVVIGTTASNSALVKYYEELPSGTIDISNGTDFPRFFPNSIMDHAMFLSRPDESPGFSKYVVGEDENFYEVGTLPTLNQGSFRIDVRDSNVGVFQDRATSDNITIFDPTTLQITGSIDMTDAFVPDDIGQRYQRFIFRGDDVFAPIRGNVNGEAFASVIFHQGNLASQEFVGEVIRNGNGFSDINTVNDFGQNFIDPSGDLYLADAGNYNGGQVWARVNRVPAGSNQIDPNYIFEPARVLNPANIFLPTFSQFKIMPNGKAIAKVNAQTPQAAIEIVLSVGGNLANLSPTQIQQIFGILFTAETAFWCELDLQSLSVTPIMGIPPVGVFSGGGNAFFHGNDVFIPVATQTENAFYKYNPLTGVAEKAFDVEGADISLVLNLANNN
ncbi:MAG: hypothetical protein AAF611_23375 [Bacteroidota bacterium]